MKKRLLCLLLAVLLLCGLPELALAEAPVPIETREDLKKVADNPSGSYLLKNDIDMGGEDWIPIPFYGTFDGGGHTLYNLTIHTTGTDEVKTYDGNRKQYDTVFGALFSVVKNAHIHDLNLVNAVVAVETDRDCFIAALAGYASGSLFERCFVSARVTLVLSGTNEGVGGMIGFCDESEISECRVDSVLTFTDVNKDIDCEEFLGGIYACGSGRIFDSEVKTRGFAEIYGYAHNGGMVGMHKLRRGSSFRPRIIRSVSDCELTFFEVAPSERCYRDALIGEDGAKDCYLSGNKILHYAADYTRTARRVRPEACENPEYEAAVTEPTCETWGYTVFTCRECGYSYTDLYTPPAHRYEAETKPATCTENGSAVYTCAFCGDSYSEILPALGHEPGEWTTAIEPETGKEGKEILSCSRCGTVLEERTLAALEPEDGPKTQEQQTADAEVTVTAAEAPQAEIIAEPVLETRIRLAENALDMTSKTTAKLTAEVYPEGTAVQWTSSDPGIVSVEQDGTLTAKKAGTAKITCSGTDGKASDACTVTVTYTFGQIIVRYVLFGWLWDR